MQFPTLNTVLARFASPSWRHRRWQRVRYDISTPLTVTGWRYAFKKSVTKSGRNLFNVPPTDGCAAAYRLLYEPKHDNAAVARDQCDLMWPDFRDLADRDFVDRFPSSFTSAGSRCTWVQPCAGPG